MANLKKSFTLKTYGAKLYEWAPTSTNVSKNPQNSGGKPFFCTATPGSQGQDWTTSYVYDVAVVDSQQQHLAYVECGYCE
jgi:hypothetical protein